MKENKQLLFRGVLILFSSWFLVNDVCFASYFPLPKSDETIFWEAEDGISKGNLKRQEHPWASGGKYIEVEDLKEKRYIGVPEFQKELSKTDTKISERSEGYLEFPFKAEALTTLRVYPIWWKHSERKISNKFLPYLFNKYSYGPDKVGFYDSYCFFTAPMAGNVGIIDLMKEKLIKSIHIGGYLSDICVDTTTKKVYICDSRNNRIVIINAEKHEVVNEVEADESPIEISLYERFLFAICSKGRSLNVIDNREGKVVKTFKFELPPFFIQFQKKDERDYLVVRQLLPKYPPEIKEMLWEILPQKVEVVKETEGKVKVQYIDISTVCNVGFLHDPTAGKEGWFRFRGDLREIPMGEHVFANVPFKIIDPEENNGKSCIAYTWVKKEDSIPINKKIKKYLYLLHGGAWAWGGEIGQIILNYEDGSKHTINVMIGRDTGNSWLEHNFGEKENGKIGYLKIKDGDFVSLFVSKFENPNPEKLVKNMVLVFKQNWGIVAMTSSDIEFPIKSIQQDIFKFSVFSLPDLAEVPVTEVKEIPGLNIYQKALPSQSKEITFNTPHVIGVDKKWIDVSEVTDIYIHKPQPILEGDIPGTVTFSVDNSLEYDWTKDIWVTPDDNLFLVNDTADFWHWNAQTFKITPGEHKLRVNLYSPFGALDGVAVFKSLENHFEVDISGLTETNDTLDWPVFYFDEPVKLKIKVENITEKSQKVNFEYIVRNYLDEVVAEKEQIIEIGKGEECEEVLDLKLKEWGAFSLKVDLSSNDGILTGKKYFLRLPKLERPGLLFRRQDISKIQDRAKKHENFFKNYYRAFKVMSDASSTNMKITPPHVSFALPVGLTHEKLKAIKQIEYDYACGLAWNLLTAQLLGMFVEPNDDFFKPKIENLIKETQRIDHYNAHHFHGAFFPGALEWFYDLAAYESPAVERRIDELFRPFFGDMCMLPSTLVSLKEPLTSQDRTLLYRILIWRENAITYLSAHHGKRGGYFWYTTRSLCKCAHLGYFFPFICLKNMFGEESFEKCLFPFRGNATLFYYSQMPDFQFGYPGFVPSRSILDALIDNPVETNIYIRKWWDKMYEEIKRLKEEDFENIDKIKKIFGGPQSLFGPIARGIGFEHGFAISLLLGWYEPGLGYEVKTEELPPTALFDAEGIVSMHSSWKSDATAIYFASGIRDKAYRDRPNHFQICKSGLPLISTLSPGTDDVNVIPSWGNVVAIGNDWSERWRLNTAHPRNGEIFDIMNKEKYCYYAGRDEKLFAPLRGGGVSVSTHAHYGWRFIKEGDIIAFETFPELDYVAGDAANCWPVENVKEIYRQLVFIKPDIIVIYDRGTLRRKNEHVSVLATTPKVLQDKNDFTAFNGNVSLFAKVLLPEKPILSVKESPYKWVKGKIVEIRPPSLSKGIEYLYAIQVSTGEVVRIDTQLVRDKNIVGVEFNYNQKKVRVIFYQTGKVGGHLSMEGGKNIDHEFTQEVLDTYKNYPDYKKWVEDKKFKFLYIK